mgnify:CR=1 FL=1
MQLYITIVYHLRKMIVPYKDTVMLCYNIIFLFFYLTVIFV